MTLKERLQYLEEIASNCERVEEVLVKCQPFSMEETCGAERLAAENQKVRKHWQRLIDLEVEEVLEEVK